MTELDREFALDRTQDRLDAYLTALFSAVGVTVERDHRRWSVSARGDPQTGIDPLDEGLASADDGTIRLVTRDELEGDGEGDESDALGPDEYVRAPDGDLMAAILAADVESTPVGHWRVADDVSNLPDPDWLANSPARATDRTFRPYYDRTAVCVGFRASIESVSEFERTVALPVAVDSETGEELPRLAEWFASVTETPRRDGERVEAVEESDLSADRLDGAVSDARRHAESLLSPAVESVRNRSVRAANVELEEYADLQAERIEELREERDRLSERLADVGERLESADGRAERLDALDERSDLREQREAVVSELDALESARQADFPEKRREVRERHSVAVEITATTATAVEYEKGDLALALEEGGRTCRLTLPYGRGVGATEAVECEQCSRALDGTHPARVGRDGVVCDSCRESE